MASLGYGLGLGRSLPLTVFFSFSSFCFSGYIVHLRCTSEGGSLVSVCCPAMLLSLLSGLYHVRGLRVSSLCHVARWHFLPPLSFQKVFVCCCRRCFVFPLFSSTIRLSFLISGLLANSWPLQLAWLGQPFWISFFVCICLHPDAMSSVVLISDLLYQSAGIVFLDGGRVSEELDMVSLAFHLFVVGTVIFASVLLCQVKSSQELLYSFTGKCATHKATKTVYICKRLTSTQQHVVSHTSQYTINTKHNHH